MGYNNYNYNGDYRKKSQKRVQSVQDMMNTSSGAGSYNNSSRNRARSKTGSYETSSYSNGTGSIAGVLFAILLCVCLLVSLLVYRSNANKSGYRYPTQVVTMTGILTDIFEENGFASGANDADSTFVAPGNLSGLSSDGSDADYLDAEATPIGTATGISGAVMLLDVGEGVDGYPEATSHAELLTQLDEAIIAGDIDFVGSKLGYTDNATGSILGYPKSVVEHFTSYMAGNTDKREYFLNSIQDADRFSKLNGSAYIVNLPFLQYKITSDYDGTVFVFSGFSERTVNRKEAATLYPILPCMYTVTATNPSWAQPIEGQVEAAMGEPLEVNFGSN